MKFRIKIAWVLSIIMAVCCMLPTQTMQTSADEFDPGTSPVTQTERGVVTPSNPAYAKVDLFNYSFADMSLDIPFTGNNGNASYANNGINQNQYLAFGGEGRPRYDTAFHNSAGWGPNINGWASKMWTKRFVDRNLGDDGYPQISIQDPKDATKTINQSLEYLFDPEIDESEKAYEKAWSDVKGLFQFNQDGNYYYDSRQNFASFEPSDTDPGTGNFTLYNRPAVSFNGSGPGQFFPFNSASQVFETNDDGSLKYTDDDLLIAKYIDASSNALKHFFGLTMEVPFSQPMSGMIGTNAQGAKVPMRFQFSGDDDVWIFIDGVLVGDLGGVHDPLGVTIDFQTGKILYFNPDGLQEDDQISRHPSTLRQAYQMAWGTSDEFVTNPTGKQKMYQSLFYSKKEVGENSNAYNTFRNYSDHTMKFFYLERGGSASNLRMEYNLQPPKAHQIRKVNENGQSIGTSADPAVFELYQADGNWNQVGTSPIGTYSTNDQGQCLLLDEKTGLPLDFTLFGSHFLLRELQAPGIYNPSKEPYQLLYDPKTDQLIVNNSYQIGAYSSFEAIMTNTDITIASAAYEGNGAFTNVGTLTEQQEQSGLSVLVPLFQSDSAERGTSATTWYPVYGSNHSGFFFVDQNLEDNPHADPAIMNANLRLAALTALQQMKIYSEDPFSPSWYLDWDDHTYRLTGDLNDLPGNAEDYTLYNSAQGTKLGSNQSLSYALVYFPESFLQQVLQPTLSEGQSVADLSKKELYEKLGSVYGSAVNVFDDSESSDALDYGIQFLSPEQFNTRFLSILYIPNVTPDLHVLKHDESGNPIAGAEFTLYLQQTDANGAETQIEVGKGVTDQNGSLIFSPKFQKDESGALSAGQATVQASPKTTTDPNQLGTGWNVEGSRYLLKETGVPDGYLPNSAALEGITVIQGANAMYPDAGSADDGITVRSQVGDLVQTMKKYATNGEINNTLHDITVLKQIQPSSAAENIDQFATGWKPQFTNQANPDLPHTIALPDPGTPGYSQEPPVYVEQLQAYLSVGSAADLTYSTDLGHYVYKENKDLSFITDTGFIRTNAMQNWKALHTQSPDIYHDTVNTPLAPLFLGENTVLIENDHKTNLLFANFVEDSGLLAPGNEKELEDFNNTKFEMTLQLSGSNLKQVKTDTDYALITGNSETQNSLTFQNESDDQNDPNDSDSFNAIPVHFYPSEDGQTISASFTIMGSQTGICDDQGQMLRNPMVWHFAQALPAGLHYTYQAAAQSDPTGYELITYDYRSVSFPDTETQAFSPEAQSTTSSTSPNDSLNDISADISVGILRRNNTVYVKDTPVPPEPSNPDQPDTDFKPVKSADPASSTTVKPGQVITYTISWKNTSTTRNDIQIVDTLDPDLEFVSDSVVVKDSAGNALDAEDWTQSNNGQAYTWTIQDQNAGSSGTISFQAKVKEIQSEKTIINTANQIIGSQQTPSNTTRHPVQVTPKPDQNQDSNQNSNQNTNQNQISLNVDKRILVNPTSSSSFAKAVTNEQTVNAKDTLRYYIRVTNTGNQKAVNLSITDKVPVPAVEGDTGSKLTLVKKSADFETGRRPVSSKVTESTSQVEWTIPQLDPGEDVIVYFDVTVPAASKLTRWSNQASVSADSISSVKSNTVLVSSGSGNSSSTSTRPNSINTAVQSAYGKWMSLAAGSIVICTTLIGLERRSRRQNEKAGKSSRK